MSDGGSDAKYDLVCTVTN